MRKANMLILVMVFFFALATPCLASSAKPEISGDAALKMLQEGNARFEAGKPQHPHADRARWGETATKGQHPFATVLSCSDSRVPVEILFDRGVGDIFVVRVAGNVAAVDEIGSMEYGVDHLGTPLLVVLGHSKCGAVTAVAQGAEVHGSIPQLVAPIAPAVAKVKAAHPGLKGEALVKEAIVANVWQAIADLLKKSEAVRKRLDKGDVKIVGALYDLEHGKVEWLGIHPEQAKLLVPPAAPEKK